ncbi:hypothetical protein RDABS01_010118 [Bienertia sinuspersici]
MECSLSLNKAMLGSLTIVVAQLMYSLPPYPYLAPEYGTQLSLFTYHMWIGGFLIVVAAAHATIFVDFTILVYILVMIPGVLKDMFLDTAIQLQLVFAQWVQNTHSLVPSTTTLVATTRTTLTWGW